MPRFQFSLQAWMDPTAPESGFRNIGVMVWSEGTLDYYAVRGNEEHARDMNGRIAESRALGREIREFVEYFLEQHGGFYYSMARPEELEADSPQDAARWAGERWELDIVVPPGTKVDPDVVRDLLAATECGADLVITGQKTRAVGRAFAMGFGALGKTVVFAYLPFPYDFSPFSRARFYVKRVERFEGGWQILGKDAWNPEAGDLVIRVVPVANPRLREAILRFKANLDDDERDVITDRLKALTDPMIPDLLT